MSPPITKHADKHDEHLNIAYNSKNMYIYMYIYIYIYIYNPSTDSGRKNVFYMLGLYMNSKAWNHEEIIIKQNIP